MAKYQITFEPMGKTVDVDSDSFCGSGCGRAGNLLDIALAAGIEIEHACGGVGVCGTCHVIIEQGEENLSPPDDDELDTVELAPGNTPSSRLACKAVVRGDATVRIPDWNRNAVRETPH